jgi:hypothetical protein
VKQKRSELIGVVKRGEERGGQGQRLEGDDLGPGSTSYRAAKQTRTKIMASQLLSSPFGIIELYSMTWPFSLPDSFIMRQQPSSPRPAGWSRRCTVSEEAAHGQARYDGFSHHGFDHFGALDARHQPRIRICWFFCFGNHRPPVRAGKRGSNMRVFSNR